MKKGILLCLSMIACLIVFIGCGDDVKKTKMSDFTGTWKQVNNESSDSYQEAIITNGVIEIYWMSDGGTTKSLYWAGSYEAPTEAVDTYSWSSVNDHSKTDTSILASSDDTKTITYSNGQISYEVSALGTTNVIKLEKQ